MTHPIVSVILCTYNDEKYIGEAIQSILDQTFSDFEFIIINDGSTDSTKDIIHSFDDSRIKYFEHPNRGQEFSKNRGIAQASGKYIAYMDGDDMSEKDRLQMQVEVLETHPEIGLCGAGIRHIGKSKGEWIPSNSDSVLRTILFFNMPLMLNTCTLRKEVLTKYNIQYVSGYEAAEDYYFLYQLLKRTKVFCIQKVLYNYRSHDAQISKKMGASQTQSAKRISYIVFKDQSGLKLIEEEWYILNELVIKQHLDTYTVKKAIAIIEDLINQIKSQAKSVNQQTLDLVSMCIDKILSRYKMITIQQPIVLMKFLKFNNAFYLRSKIPVLAKSAHYLF